MLPYFHLFLSVSILRPSSPTPSLFFQPSSLSFFLSCYLPVSLPSLSTEAHQGKQMLWLLFMFPLGLPFIQIIHRACTVQTLSLTGVLWQLSQPRPRSDALNIPQTLRWGGGGAGMGGQEWRSSGRWVGGGGGGAHRPTE